jgi:DNA-binding NtrC family response regulator
MSSSSQRIPSASERETVARILVVDDDEDMLSSLCELLVAMGWHPTAAASATAEWLERNKCEVVLLDIMMPGIDGITFLSQLRSTFPDLPVVMMTGQPSMERAIACMREGAADFLIKPFEIEDLGASVRRALILSRGAIFEKQSVRERSLRIVSASEAMKNILSSISQMVAAGCDTILITGETGTGKEVVARELHAQAGLVSGAFVAVSCPSLPDQLVESELFGHVKGSFTGADAGRKGMLSMAEGGMLFLDEVGDLSHHGQSSLLRVLESRRYRPVGSDIEKTMNTCVVAATNVPLEEFSGGRTFRSDLYYRLAVHQINIPPLRERREDILPLAEHFLALCRTVRVVTSRDFDEGARSALLAHNYPGNSRELRNIVERAAVMSNGDLIEARHLQIWKPAGETIDPRAHRFENSSEAYKLIEALEKTKWNRRKAAELLNIPYSTLRYKLKILGVD